MTSRGKQVKIKSECVLKSVSLIGQLLLIKPQAIMTFKSL